MIEDQEDFVEEILDCSIASEQRLDFDECRKILHNINVYVTNAVNSSSKQSQGPFYKITDTRLKKNKEKERIDKQ